MFQLKNPRNSPFEPMLVEEEIYLRPPQSGDFSHWRELREQSRANLVQWEDDWLPDNVGRAAFRRRLRLVARDANRAVGIGLFAFRRSDRRLVGGVSLTNIRYGAARAATIGYWIGTPHLRAGFGAAAVSAVVRHSFETIRLNRVEAACQPENTASMGLLDKCGFQLEGRARHYLRINGVWRDHDLFAITAGDYRSFSAN